MLLPRCFLGEGGRGAKVCEKKSYILQWFMPWDMLIYSHIMGRRAIRKKIAWQCSLSGDNENSLGNTCLVEWIHSPGSNVWILRRLSLFLVQEGNLGISNSTLRCSWINTAKFFVCVLGGPGTCRYKEDNSLKGQVKNQSPWRSCCNQHSSQLARERKSLFY